ncbi:NTP transferase domain-containing protein [Campylobacter sp. RM9328]|uniref:NTP transferase domain-containing protein n=1 Tax=Campylobacter sp. RM9328 TaxID=1705720 RepID=UPI0014762207|nr:NTP transferase domain-containing protein [Campylobacter sp. RM9328]
MKTCVILAGGKSSRMGQDKTLLPFGEFNTLTHFQFNKFSKIFTNVFISSKFDKFIPPLPLLKDISQDYSPMLALASVLANFKDEKIFIIPADMPFVSKECVTKLYEYSDKFDIVIAQDKEFSHSLCGFFNSNISKKALELYQNGEHKIGLLQNFYNVKKVKFDNAEQFFNVNDPSQYQIALKMKQI